MVNSQHIFRTKQIQTKLDITYDLIDTYMNRVAVVPNYLPDNRFQRG